MMRASFTGGDMQVTLTETFGQDKSPGFFLHFVEFAIAPSTNTRQYTHYIEGENDAYLSFAAVIAADEALTGRMAELLAQLRDSPAHTFLP